MAIRASPTKESYGTVVRYTVIVVVYILGGWSKKMLMRARMTKGMRRRVGNAIDKLVNAMPPGDRILLNPGHGPWRPIFTHAAASHGSDSHFHSRFSASASPYKAFATIEHFIRLMAPADVYHRLRDMYLGVQGEYEIDWPGGPLLVWPSRWSPLSPFTSAVHRQHGCID